MCSPQVISLNYSGFGTWYLEVEPVDGVPWWWGVTLAFLLLAALLVGVVLSSAMAANTLHKDILLTFVPTQVHIWCGVWGNRRTQGNE